MCHGCLGGDPAAGAASKVDRQRRTIFGVKVVSQKSRNGRRYTAECLRRAIPLYEGVSVRIDHPDRRDDDGDRKADSVMGELHRVRSGPGGLYADLRYLQTHPMSERICEAADHMPKAYGLSHNVSDWDGHYEDGEYVVTEIREVESVDLVADPATTNGLFESKKKRRKGGRIKLQEWVRKQKAPVRQAFRRLVEAGAASPSMLLADGGDPEASIKSAFRSAMNAVLDDDAADLKTKMSKMKEILGAQEKLMASGAVTPPTSDDEPLDDTPMDDADDEAMTEEDDAEFGDDYDGAPEDDDLGGDDDTLEEGDDEVDYDETLDEEESSRVKESDAKRLRKELAEAKEKAAQAERELAVRRLCEAEDHKPSKPLLKALLKLDDDDDRRALLRESRKAGRATPAKADRPFAELVAAGDDDEDDQE